MFAIFLVGDFIIHGPVLGHFYKSLGNLWRPDMMSYIWIMGLVIFIFSFILMFIFIKGYEGRGILEGLRFGIIAGVLINGIGAFGQYVIYPLPLSLVVQWFVYGIIEFIAAGIAAESIYKQIPDDEDEEEDELEIV